MALGTLQIAGYAFPLITMPYLAHILGVLYIGKIAFAGAVIAYFQTLVDYGFNYTATRDVARYKEDTDKISILFSSVIYCKAFLVLVSAIILGCMTIIISPFRDNAYIFWATFILLPGYAMFPEWLFQGLEKMKYITILNLLSKLFFTIAVFILVKDKSDYIWQPILTGIGYIAAGLISLYILRKKMDINFVSIRKCNLLQTMRGSTDVFINQLMPNLYNNFSVMLLGMCGTPNANGLFEAGNKLVSIADRMLNVVSRAFYPFLSRRLDKHSLYAKYQLILATCCSCILFLMAEPLIIFLFSKEFISAVWALRILAISMFFISITHVYGVNYLILRGKERQLRNITFLISFGGMLIAYPIISYFDYLGAAIIVGMTRILLGGAIYLYSKNC